MTEENVVKKKKKGKKIAIIVVSSVLAVLVLACIFWEQIFLLFYMLMLNIKYHKNRFHSCEGIYKCSETIELSNGIVIEEFYFDFERITYNEYKKHQEQYDHKEINFVLQGDDKNGYYLVKAYLKLSGDEEVKEYPVRAWHYNPKYRRIEIEIQDLDEIIGIQWSYGDYNFVDSKKYKRVLSSIDFQFISIESISTDEKGNHSHTYIDKEFKLEYQGEIE